MTERRADVRPSLAELLAAHDLLGAKEEPFPNDGWSGARLTRLRGSDRSYVLKRTSWEVDWIVRATGDRRLREAAVADGALGLGGAVATPHLGTARDGDGVALLMPDLSETLLAWEGPLEHRTLSAVLAGLASLHAREVPADAVPWCPVPARLALLGRPAARRYAAEGLPAGPRFLAGWDAFDRAAPVAAVELVRALEDDPAPLLSALARLPAALCHGDVKLGNVGFRDGSMLLIDWAMVLRAPVAVELGWFLVSNVASLPAAPDVILDEYAGLARSARVPLGDWSAQVDLAWIVGLLLRGWRKGLDAEARLALPDGMSAERDLERWASFAVAAASRRL